MKSAMESALRILYIEEYCHFAVLGPVVQSIVSLTTSLKRQLVIIKARCTQLRRAIDNVRCEGRIVMNKTQRLLLSLTLSRRFIH